MVQNPTDLDSLLGVEVQKFGHAFSFPSKISLHQFNNFFHLHISYSCEIMGPRVKKRAHAENSGRESVWKGVEFCSITVMSPLFSSIPKLTQSRNIHETDNQYYSPNPGTWLLIQTPTRKGSHPTLKWKPRDSIPWRKSLPHDVWHLNREARTSLVLRICKGMGPSWLLFGHLEVVSYSVASSRPCHCASHSFMSFFTKHLLDHLLCVRPWDSTSK